MAVNISLIPLSSPPTPGRHLGCGLLAASAIALALAACGSGGGHQDPADGGGPGAVLVIAPATAEVELIDGQGGLQAFTATIEEGDQAPRDVTGSAAFSLSSTELGSFSGATFTASGLTGGTTEVIATAEGLTATATLRVIVRETRVIEPAPADAAALFEAATEDAALAPSVVYPSGDSVVPLNLGNLDVHFTEAGNDLFEVRLQGDDVDVRVYTLGTAGTGGRYEIFLPEEWRQAALSERSGTLRVSVRGLKTASPTTAGTSAEVTLHPTNTDIEGGLYYWAASAVGGPAGIYRHDMSNPGEPPEQYFTTAESPSGRCVACHVLSRAGDKMALTFDGGNGAATIIDVATRVPDLPVDGTFAWNFAAYSPDGKRLLTVSRGVATLRNPVDGSVVTTVPTAGYATHPDFSPNGDAIVYTVPASATQDWIMSGGTIVTQAFDATTDTFGSPVVLVDTDENNYYPSYSPDGAWIAFNRSVEDSYDDASATLWIVRADGSQAPFRLTTPDLGDGLTNSWMRWAPFVQSYGKGEALERVFWMTFSSKRDFGVRLVGAGRPQLWMTPFFADRATNGSNATAPGFYLPFQSMLSNNHIAQWTETVVPVE